MRLMHESAMARDGTYMICGIKNERVAQELSFLDGETHLADV
jgi:hypothetical protein